MDLLLIYIKEREFEWTKNVALCAERFTAQGALRSSGFQLSLVDLVVQELEVRCSLYLEHGRNPMNFDEFFKDQKTNLSSGLKTRFGVSGPGEERYNLLQEKYRALLLSNRPPVPKSPIGFNIKPIVEQQKEILTGI